MEFFKARHGARYPDRGLEGSSRHGNLLHESFSLPRNLYRPGAGVSFDSGSPEESTLDVQLAVSRDSVHFTRVGDRHPFITLGDVGAWDRFNLSLANNDPVPVQDDLRFYYGGRMYRHGPYAGKDKGPEKSGIGIASVKRDRFVALQASFDGGEIVTRPLKLKSSELRLNAKSDFGEIGVEVMSSEGKILAKSKSIERDGLDLAVEWVDEFKPPAEPVALRLKLKNARLYSLWCP